jgi:hypothetical protein
MRQLGSNLVVCISNLHQHRKINVRRRPLKSRFGACYVAHVAGKESNA